MKSRMISMCMIGQMHVRFQLEPFEPDFTVDRTHRLLLCRPNKVEQKVWWNGDRDLHIFYVALNCASSSSVSSASFCNIQNAFLIICNRFVLCCLFSLFFSFFFIISSLSLFLSNFHIQFITLSSNQSIIHPSLICVWLCIIIFIIIIILFFLLAKTSFRKTFKKWNRTTSFFIAFRLILFLNCARPMPIRLLTNSLMMMCRNRLHTTITSLDHHLLPFVRPLRTSSISRFSAAIVSSQLMCIAHSLRSRLPLSHNRQLLRLILSICFPAFPRSSVNWCVRSFDQPEFTFGPTTVVHSFSHLHCFHVPAGIWPISIHHHQALLLELAANHAKDHSHYLLLPPFLPPALPSSFSFVPEFRPKSRSSPLSSILLLILLFPLTIPFYFWLTLSLD